MCYPTPGPRCSNHAYKEYVEAEARFVKATDPDEKLHLGIKLKEKQDAYDTTPRGQNDLRRQADLAMGLDKDLLKMRMEKGATTRQQQLDDYFYSVQNKNTSFSELMATKEGYNKGRYQDASGMALLYLNHRFPNKEFHLEKIGLITTGEQKILVIPSKYQETWGSYTFDGEEYDSYEHKLTAILNSKADLLNPTPVTEEKMFAWWVDKLKEDNYFAIAVVNRLTQDVALINIDDAPKVYDISFKSRKRLGGTTNYIGGKEEIESLITDTIFASGTVVESDEAHKTAIYGVPPQPKDLCVLSPEIYLSWREMDEGQDGYFEVRRRHVSNNYNLIVALKIKRQLVINGISSHLDWK